MEKFGFAILTARAISELAKLVGTDAQILEVGAGSGYWSYELHCAGIEAWATDPGYSGH